LLAHDAKFRIAACMSFRDHALFLKRDIRHSMNPINARFMI